jgi:hypothetical protein
MAFELPDSLWPLICESFSVRLFQGNVGSFSVCQKSRVVAMVKLREIKRQVLFGERERAERATPPMA